MLTITERPTVFQLTRNAWRSLFQAARRMAPLFLCGMILLAGFDLAKDWLMHALGVWPLADLERLMRAGDRVSWIPILKTFDFDIARELVRAVLTAPIAVAVHRFILLGEVRRFYFFSRLTLRFSGWVFALSLPPVMFSWLVTLSLGKSFFVFLPLFVLFVALILFWIMVMLLFPAAAVEEPETGILKQIEIALERGKRVFWLGLSALLLGYLAFFLLQFLIGLPFRKRGHTTLFDRFDEAVTGVFAIALFAAVASWLYGYAAQRTAAGPSLWQALFRRPQSAP